MRTTKVENGWILCSKCRHKLARIVKEGIDIEVQATSISSQKIEFKCHSCKELNLYGGGIE